MGFMAELWQLSWLITTYRLTMVWFMIDVSNWLINGVNINQQTQLGGHHPCSRIFYCRDLHGLSSPSFSSAGEVSSPHPPCGPARDREFPPKGGAAGFRATSGSTTIVIGAPYPNWWRLAPWSTTRIHRLTIFRGMSGNSTHLGPCLNLRSFQWLLQLRSWRLSKTFCGYTWVMMLRRSPIHDLSPEQCQMLLANLKTWSMN